MVYIWNLDTIKGEVDAVMEYIWDEIIGWETIRQTHWNSIADALGLVSDLDGFADIREELEARLYGAIRVYRYAIVTSGAEVEWCDSLKDQTKDIDWDTQLRVLARNEDEARLIVQLYKEQIEFECGDSIKKEELELEFPVLTLTMKGWNDTTRY